MLAFERICTVATAAESYPAEPLAYTAGTMGLVLLSRGKCNFFVGEEKLTGWPGCVLLSAVPFTVEPLGGCHCLTVTFSGVAAEELCAELPHPLVQDSGIYPPLSQLLISLISTDTPLTEKRRSALGYEILCMLEPDAQAGKPQTPYPPLVQEAVQMIREDYAKLYGVEDLSDRLGVSKSHLIRVFRAALGMTPGHFLADTRLEAAKLLLLRGHSLEVTANLCGFAGANYFCKVFKRSTGMTPLQYRRTAGQSLAAATVPEEDAADIQLYL